jgi:hypothetical protein
VGVNEDISVSRTRSRAANRTVVAVTAAACIALSVGAERARAGEVTQVARPCQGSSNPTFYPNNRRVAVTHKGRLLAVYDPHGSGVQIAWRDPGAPWQRSSRGAVSDGLFELRDEIGDRPASIALARDARGHEHAWVVWSGRDFSPDHLLSVEMVRLSGLDDRRGPKIGAPVTVQPAGEGNARVDLAFERARHGKRRGVIAWLRRTGASTFLYVTAWFTNLRSNSPDFHHRSVLFKSTNGHPTGTLVPKRTGMRIVVSTPRGKLRVYTHRRKRPLERWTAGAKLAPAWRGARPSAVKLASSGNIVAAVGSSSGVTEIVRFSGNGDRGHVALKLRGRGQPTVAAHRRSAWVFMVRGRDGFLVSRRYNRRSGWSSKDRVEVGSSGGGVYAFPNVARTTRGGLNLLLQGRRCANNPNGNEVLAYRRSI